MYPQKNIWEGDTEDFEMNSTSEKNPPSENVSRSMGIVGISDSKSNENPKISLFSIAFAI